MNFHFQTLVLSHICGVMPLRRCTVELANLSKRELEEFHLQRLSTSPTMTPRRSARSTRGEGWPEPIRRFFTEKTPEKDLNEEASSLTQEESSGKTLAERRLMELLLKDVNLMKARVLGTLKNQEDRIDELNKDLEGGKIRVGALEEESMKRKEQVLRMKSLNIL